MRRPVRAEVGLRPEPRTFGPLTQTDLVRFAGAGGDFNPLHHDPAFAQAAGFADPIAMGQFTAGLLAGWLTDWCGVEHLQDYEVRFTGPFALGDTVELRGEVTAVRPIEDDLGLADLELVARNATADLLRGQATVVVTRTP